MESAIKTLVSVYLKSAKGKDSLGEKDFQNLVKNKLSNIMTDTDSKDAIKEMRQGLDSDADGKVGFQEYLTLVGYLASNLSDQRTTTKETPAAEGEQEEAS
ncbi:protein S100-A16 [Paramormyrops kingsleyae]|uniref:Protein S100-A16-like n=1 Tax=Paramormyrops kingsleyae TaxID=1676925 RepID=A0A3B3RC48_9TELE|nr:protein S100-A16-like [Paramormyrops kingsleyae]